MLFVLFYTIQGALVGYMISGEVIITLAAAIIGGYTSQLANLHDVNNQEEAQEPLEVEEVRLIRV